MRVADPVVDTARDADAAYVYGVTWANEVPRIRDGVAGSDVVEVGHGRLAALVSSVDASTIRARRRDLLRHADVLRSAAANATVVPFAFGTVFESSSAVVRDLLAPREGDLVRLLERLAGHAELTVRASYREDEILREIAREDPQVARLRARGEATLELGEAVARALASRRSAEGEAILRRLRPLAAETAVDDPVGELEVIRAAFLVSDAGVAAFDAEMDELARARSALVFDYVGPLPAFHFARLSGGSQ